MTINGKEEGLLDRQLNKWSFTHKIRYKQTF